MHNPAPDSYQYYKNSSITGLKWSGLTEILIRIFQFGVTVILARVLVPEDFGQITLALVVVKFIQFLIDFGIASALIQKQEISEQHYNFTFTFLTLVSALFMILLYFFSGGIARLLADEKISDLIKYLSFSIPLTAWNLLPRSILNRDLAFKRIALAEMVSIAGSGILTIVLAILWRDATCFVAGVIAEQILLGIWLWTYGTWKPRFLFSRREGRDLFNFSSIVFGTRLVNFINLNLLNVLIGRFFGHAVLGFFSLAFQLIDMPTQRIAKTIMKIMFPVLSRLQKQPVEYKDLLLKSMYVILIIILPFFFLLYVLAEPFVRIFYGEKWLESIFFIKVLCVIGLARSLWTAISVVSMSLGKPQFELFLNLAILLLVFPGIFMLAAQGIGMVLLYYILVYFLIFIFGEVRIFQWLRVSAKNLWLYMRNPLLIILLLTIFIESMLLVRVLDFEQNLLLKFTAASLLYALTYGLLMYLLDRRKVSGLISALIKKK